MLSWNHKIIIFVQSQQKNKELFLFCFVTKKENQNNYW